MTLAALQHIDGASRAGSMLRRASALVRAQMFLARCPQLERKRQGASMLELTPERARAPEGAAGLHVAFSEL